MAAPAAAEWFSFSFRDSKGNTSRVRMLVGGASVTANFNTVTTAVTGLKALLQATTNATTWLPQVDGPLRTLGTTAEYETIEDKAVLTFQDPAGFLHRFQLPAPKAAGFYSDKETVNSAETNMAALIAGIVGNVYGRPTDTAPLAYIGGIRRRVKFQRRFNIITRDPSLTTPGE